MLKKHCESLSHHQCIDLFVQRKYCPHRLVFAVAFVYSLDYLVINRYGLRTSATGVDTFDIYIVVLYEVFLSLAHVSCNIVVIRMNFSLMRLIWTTWHCWTAGIRPVEISHFSLRFRSQYYPEPKSTDVVQI